MTWTWKGELVAMDHGCFVLLAMAYIHIVPFVDFFCSAQVSTPLLPLSTSFPPTQMSRSLSYGRKKISYGCLIHLNPSMIISHHAAFWIIWTKCSSSLQ